LDETDFFDGDLERWNQQFEQYRHSWMDEFNQENATTEAQMYNFKPARDYATHPDPFSVGMQLLSRGNLSESILAFEEDVQRNPESSKAWMWLGLAQVLYNIIYTYMLYSLYFIVSQRPTD
jgi:hypothetical protein